MSVSETLTLASFSPSSVILTLAFVPLSVTAWLRYVSPSIVTSSVSVIYSPDSSTILGSETESETLDVGFVVVVVSPEEITTLILSSAEALFEAPDSP